MRVVAGAALAILGNNGACRSWQSGRLQVLTRKAIANPGRTGASKSRKMVSCESWQRERLQILARMALASAGEVGSCKFRHGGRLQILTKRELVSPGKVGSCKSWRGWRLHDLAKMALGKTVATKRTWLRYIISKKSRTRVRHVRHRLRHVHENRTTIL